MAQKSSLAIQEFAQAASKAEFTPVQTTTATPHTRHSVRADIWSGNQMDDQRGYSVEKDGVIVAGRFDLAGLRGTRNVMSSIPWRHNRQEVP
jgi:hypothetical protein